MDKPEKISHVVLLSLIYKSALMENTGFNFWMFIAGLGIFLLGMRQLEKSFKGLARKSFPSGKNFYVTPD